MSVQLGHSSGQGAAVSRYRDRGRREAGAKGRRPPEQRPRDLRPQFRLRPGEDDLLIEWLTSLAPRRRSAAIRRALHQHLAAREEQGGGGDRTEDPDLAAALDALF
jgi:hypothetical protein